MGFLTDYEDSCINYKGRRYRLDLSYDAVLNVQRMYREKKLDDVDLLQTALDIFVPGATEKLPLQDKSELLERICTEKISTKPRPTVGAQQKLFDFEEDGEYIYASFLQDYGLDLIDQQGGLPWQRFIALFQGLTDKTKIREVMRIRGMELPAPTKTNQKEIQNLMEMKAYYALGYREENGKDGLNRLFSMLEHAAK